MKLEYDEEEYRFRFEEFYNPYFMNPKITNMVKMLFSSKKQLLSIQGQSKDDGNYSGFAEGIDPSTLRVAIGPENPDKVWTEALIINLKIIP